MTKVIHSNFHNPFRPAYQRQAFPDTPEDLVVAARIDFRPVDRCPTVADILADFVGCHRLLVQLAFLGSPTAGFGSLAAADSLLAPVGPMVEHPLDIAYYAVIVGIQADRIRPVVAAVGSLVDHSPPVAAEVE